MLPLKRQNDILRLLEERREMTVKEICAEMHISPATVFNHLKMEKGNEEEQGM